MITHTEAVERVKQLAEAEYGPLGAIKFEFIPLEEGLHLGYNWDLFFRPAPMSGDVFIQARADAIQRALDKVRGEHPMVR